MRRSYQVAWTDYAQKHVVSLHAVRIIKNFMSKHMAESAEALEEEEDKVARQAMGEVDTSWASVDMVHQVLSQSEMASTQSAGNKSSKSARFEQQLNTALKIGCDLWALDGVPSEDQPPCFQKGRNFTTDLQPVTKEMAKKESKKQSKDKPTSVLLYVGLTKRLVDKWMADLQEGRITNSVFVRDALQQQLKPNTEQKTFLRRVASRCLHEKLDEMGDGEHRSEPERFCLHGVLGAGKSQSLKWLRLFFEEVCGWTHGRQFVFMASQNTMAAIIEGFTLHSYGEVPMNKTGLTKSGKRPGTTRT